LVFTAHEILPYPTGNIQKFCATTTGIILIAKANAKREEALRAFVEARLGAGPKLIPPSKTSQCMFVTMKATFNLKALKKTHVEFETFLSCQTELSFFTKQGYQYSCLALKTDAPNLRTAGYHLSVTVRTFERACKVFFFQLRDMPVFEHFGIPDQKHCYYFCL
jgi:hypothetical protein